VTYDLMPSGPGPSDERGLGISPDLPHTDTLAPLRLGLLRIIRRPSAWIIRSWWRVRLVDQHLVPRTGPVILAVNHMGTLDGPLVIAETRRPVLAMAKHELFAGRFGRILLRIGQVPVRRREIDLAGIRLAVQVLRAGQVLAVFPEGVRTGGDMAYSRGGAVYLALVTGAPIVPVAILGTRQRGGGKSSLPRRGSQLAVVYGPPIYLPQLDWPRRKTVVAEWNEAVRVQLAAHIAKAVARTSITLPGPVPRPGGISA